MKTIILENKNEVFSCKIPVSQETWLRILQDKTTEDQMKALLYFYYADKNTGTCKSIGVKHNVSASSINSAITSFGQMAQRVLNIFEIVREDKTQIYWAIPMAQGRTLDKENSLFEWTLREELVQAIRQYLYLFLIRQYKQLRSNIPFRDEEQDEVYKWELITECAGKEDMFIAERVTRSNLVYVTLTRGTISYLIENKRDEFSLILNDLLRGDSNLDSKVRAFKDYMAKAVPQKFNYKANDERTAAAILTCFNPQKYTFYKFEVYQALCQYLGIETKETGLCFSHFQKLIVPLKELIDKDVELLELVKSSTNGCLQSSLLVAQDILWMVLVSHPKTYLGYLYQIVWSPVYWCVGFNFGSNNSQLERFIKEGIWEGRFNPKESADKRQIAVANKIKDGDILILKSSATKGEGHKVPFVRIRAIAQVTGIQDNQLGEDGYLSIIRNIHFINSKLSTDFDGSTYGKYRKTIDECSHNEIKEYINSIINMPNIKYQKIMNLLETNRNLILTGAPGTGKTYMAKEIAAQIMFGKGYHSLSDEERGQIGFVQFHPSYDYTDFVEGLRPIQDEKGNVGFVLRKGIFKEYCAKALEKYDSGNFDKAYDSMISEMGEDTIKLKTPQGNDFGISLNSRGNLRLHTGKDLRENGVLTRESLKAEFSGTPVYRWWKGYYAGVIDYIKSKYHVSQIQNDSNKKYVFIIDEINRGEISKIFGELFYSIDPGYRGKDGQVKTQYANMATEPNEFDIALGTTDYGHFFIPENVYIIGTMNDIDRSVESMDFAMRRRFTWKEVTAADSYTAIIENNNEFAGNKAEVKQRMERLNAEIEKRFGRAYQIGAAYFLNLQNNDFEALWKNHLEGLLFEYFRGERDAQQKVDALHAIYNNEPSDTNIG